MPYWQVEQQETLCHWQHSCLSSLFFLFIDWEYYLPLHAAVDTSLAAEIYRWLLSNRSIRAQGDFCWAAGQSRKLGGSQVTSTHWDFRQTPGSFFDSSMKWGVAGRRRCTEQLPHSISLSGCLSQPVSRCSIRLLNRARSIFSRMQSWAWMSRFAQFYTNRSEALKVFSLKPPTFSRRMGDSSSRHLQLVHVKSVGVCAASRVTVRWLC